MLQFIFVHATVLKQIAKHARIPARFLPCATNSGVRSLLMKASQRQKIEQTQ